MRRREDARGRSRLRYSFHSVDHPWSDHHAVGAGEAVKLVEEVSNLVGEDRLEIVEGFGVVDVEGGTVAQEPMPEAGLTTVIAGDSRMSSVSALKATPRIATVLPEIDPPRRRRILAAVCSF